MNIKNFKPKLFVILIFITIALVNSYSYDDDDYYVGAVLEYAPPAYNFKDPNETPVKYVLANVKQYNSYAQTAKNQGAQIIVFPEYGLLGGAFATRDDVLPYLEVIPDPHQSSSPIIPCNNEIFDNRTILQSLSCIAIENSIVLVADMGDVQYCDNSTSVDNCPSDGRFQYNTQVAFSEKGELLAKYHKSHLYGEPFFNPSTPPDPVIFSTDFNVTFGMFICFDILFEEPQKTLIEKYGIHNLVYSTEWVNVNYAYARGVQESWSKLYNANVLAANIGVTSAISGSGIYSNGNFINSYQNPTTKPANKLLIGKLPKDPTKSTSASNTLKINNNRGYESGIETIDFIDYEPFKREYDGKVNSIHGDIETPTSINATIIPFTISENQVNQTIVSSNNDLICTFTYSTGDKIDKNRLLYSLVSFSGNFNNFFNSQLCSASICGSNDPSSCFDNVFDSSSVFTSIKIEGNFQSDYHIVPTFTTYPLVDNYLATYQFGDQFISVSNIEQYFIGTSLFAIQWNDTSSSDNLSYEFI
ncbi:hypothetical protein RB653_004068 [Dictyostelium firmibasis]|uniref:CN hydrolase domain-containing protein n=1 Tax=Dictyostelium firmibasis TaxID=79012 RepID=A0AAN7UIN5_9MYCE